MTDSKPDHVDEMRYYAFISYSHQDREWGDWIHKALETYKVPRALVGSLGRDGAVPKRLFPVFRDREELPTSADLGENIGQALRSSRYLIVICSPRSAQSKWVNEEIRAFKALGRENRVLCLIVDGEPNTGNPETEAFPDAVKFKVDADGALTSDLTEPIAADAREHADGKENAKLKLLAGLLGVSFDKLAQRDKKRKQRQRLIAGSAAAALLAAGGFAFWQTQSANFERRVSEAETAAQAALSFARNDQMMMAMEKLTAAVPDDLVRADRVPGAARAALYEIMATNHMVAEMPVGDTGFDQIDYDAKAGLALLRYQYGIQVHDAQTLRRLYRLEVIGRVRAYHIDHEAGRIIVLAAGEITNWGPQSTLKVYVFDLETGAELALIDTERHSLADPIFTEGRVITAPLVKQEGGEPATQVISWAIDDAFTFSDPQLLAVMSGYGDIVHLGADSARVIIETRDNRVGFFDGASGQKLSETKIDDPFVSGFNYAVSDDGAMGVINRIGGPVTLIDLQNGSSQDVLQGMPGCIEEDGPLTRWINEEGAARFLIQNCGKFTSSYSPTNMVYTISADDISSAVVTPVIEVTRTILDLDQDGVVMLLDRGTDGVWRTAGRGDDQRDVPVTNSDISGVTDATFVDDANTILTLHGKGILRRMEMQTTYDIIAKVGHGEAYESTRVGALSPDGQSALVKKYDGALQLVPFDRGAEGALPVGVDVQTDLMRWQPSEYVSPIISPSYWAMLYERQDDYGRKIQIGNYQNAETTDLQGVLNVDWIADGGTGDHLLVIGKDGAKAEEYFWPEHLFVGNRQGQLTDTTQRFEGVFDVRAAAVSDAHQSVLTTHGDRSARFWRLDREGRLSDPVVIIPPAAEYAPYPELVAITSANGEFGAILEVTDPFSMAGGIANAPDDRVTVIDMKTGKPVGALQITIPRQDMALWNLSAVLLLNDGRGLIAPYGDGATQEAALLTIADGSVRKLGTPDGAGVGLGELLNDQFYLTQAGDVYDLTAHQFVAKDLVGIIGLRAAEPLWVDGSGSMIGVGQAAMPLNADSSCLIDPRTVRPLYCVPGTLLEGGILNEGEGGQSLITIDYDQIIRHQVPAFEQMRDRLFEIVKQNRANALNADAAAQ